MLAVSILFIAIFLIVRCRMLQQSIGTQTFQFSFSIFESNLLSLIIYSAIYIQYYYVAMLVHFIQLAYKTRL